VSMFGIRTNFFFFMVVANCNVSCYWLQVSRLKPKVAPVIFLSGFKVGFVATLKASCGKL